MADATSLLVPIRDSGEYERLLADSHDRPHLLLKHSLTCSVSTWALAEVRAALESEGDGIGSALLEIQNSRPLSAEVAQRTGVRHESPQALLFVGGVALWDASHWDLARDAVSRVLREHGPSA